jgi:hypothetical protein
VLEREVLSSLICHLPLLGKEKGAILPEKMPLIKADKTNRATFPVVMVLKAGLIMLLDFTPIWALLNSIYDKGIYTSKI